MSFLSQNILKSLLLVQIVDLLSLKSPIMIEDKMEESFARSQSVQLPFAFF